MKDGRDEIAKTKSSVLSHVAENEGREDVVVDLESDVEEGVAESFRPQDARLLFGVRLESRLPLLQAGHKVPKVGQFQTAQSRHVENQNELAANVQVGAALDVIYSHVIIKTIKQNEEKRRVNCKE